jgi:hypothetical protein
MFYYYKKLFREFSMYLSRRKVLKILSLFVPALTIGNLAGCRDEVDSISNAITSDENDAIDLIKNIVRKVCLVTYTHLEKL